MVMDTHITDGAILIMVGDTQVMVGATQDMGVVIQVMVMDILMQHLMHITIAEEVLLMEEITMAHTPIELLPILEIPFPTETVLPAEIVFTIETVVL